MILIKFYSHFNGHSGIVLSNSYILFKNIQTDICILLSYSASPLYTFFFISINIKIYRKCSTKYLLLWRVLFQNINIISSLSIIIISFSYCPISSHVKVDSPHVCSLDVLATPFSDNQMRQWFSVSSVRMKILMAVDGS